MPCAKEVTWKPMTGLLDTTSSPDEMPPGSFRKRQNVAVNDDGIPFRYGGFSKFMDATPYNNADLHDQLLTLLDDTSTDQTINLLFQSTTTRGGRQLIAGTTGRLYALNEGTSNWRIIAEGYGGASTRFKAGQVGDIMVFTNDYNSPVSWVVEQESQAVEIADLAVIGLGRAKVIWSWKGVMFLADVEMDGQRYQNKIVWSDYNNPLSWSPESAGTIAGEQDLGFNEKILGGVEFGNAFYILTTLGIWEMTAIGGERVFSFKKRYFHDKGYQCAYFPNTIITAGDYILYVGTEAIYAWNPNFGQPEIINWIDVAVGKLFRTLDHDCCENFIAASRSNTREAIFSFPTTGVNCVANQTIVFNLRYEFAYTLDVGYSALLEYLPYSSDTIRNWLITRCICTSAELTAAGYTFEKEGDPGPDPAVTCDVGNTPTSIYTSDPLVVGQNEALADVICEDYTKVSADVDSLCALLDGQRFDDICRACNAAAIFIGAYTVDNCLKSLDESGYRETRVDDAYSLLSFDSTLIGCPLFSLKGTIVASRASVEFDPTAQSPPSDLELSIGESAQVADPAEDGCGVVWKDQPSKPLKCGATLTAVQYKARNLRPSRPTEWNIHLEGEFIFWQLQITGTGGLTKFTRFSLWGAEKERCRY